MTLVNLADSKMTEIDNRFFQFSVIRFNRISSEISGEVFLKVGR